MAAALVGGSVVSAFLQVLFDRMASHEVLDFLKGRKLNDGLLMKLKTTMISVNGLLDDAEEKQVSKPAVKEWLDELKDALYEADDLLGDIAYEAQKSKFEAGSQFITNQVRNFFSFRDPFGKEMETNLEKILDRLEYLVKQKDALGLNLKEGIGNEKHSLQRTPTTSVVDEYGFYARDGDKNSLIDLLLSDDANGNGLGVIPIVGMGGIGKTTLAQHIYNDNRVKEWFDLKAWVCVSEEFNIFKMTKDIFEEVSSKTCDASTLNKLQLELKTRLKGKKFLLILDDVWNDKYDDWEILQRPLKAGAQGSKIVVTTRNQSVASVMCTVPTHHLKELTDEDCWFLFAKHAFVDGNSNSHSDLEVIGREIVRKCKGLPLAAKAMGGLLRSKRNVKEWEKVLASSMWDLTNDNILPALRLSYHYLPSHLKRCFAYCAILPKDYHILKDQLIFLWMAEGYLDQPKGNKEAIDLGEEYFHDLMSRSFFQQSSPMSTHFVMHDLVNDLAKLVSGEFFVRLDDDNACKITKKTRHLSYLRMSYDDLERFEPIYDAKLLRTFLPVSLLHYWIYEEIDSKVLHDLLPTLTQLRVLSLSHYDNIATLPDSISKLRHLRYLSLAGTPIKRLPESVISLYNLQSLILRKCTELVELPINMVKLINLYHLEITNTSLKEMPHQMGKLTKLRRLTDFVLGSQSGSSIEQLGELQHLGGRLWVWNLQNVVDAKDATQAHLKGKKHLKELQLRWDSDTDDSFHDRDVLEQLEPHSNVENLLIVGYGGTRFPHWVGDSSFSNVVFMELSGCKYCHFLPPLGQLLSLKVLSIKAFNGVVSIGPEFYGNCTSMKNPFGSLEILRFERMPQWREWILYGDGAFPLLQKLSIKKCPNLTNTLPSNLPSLTTLEIEGCQQLEASLPRSPVFLSIKFADDSRNLWFGKMSSGLQRLKIERFQLHPLDSLLVQMGSLATHLHEIEIRNCHSLKCFHLELFPNLKTLSINECRNLEFICGFGGCLSSLVISNCPTLVSFSRGGIAAPNLTFLELRDCLNLKALPDCMHSQLPSLVDLRLYHCAELMSFPEGGLPLKLQSLQIHHCNKLFAGRLHWELQRLPSLSQFLIGTIEDVESFPQDTLLPSTITSLTISSYKNLKSLDCNGLQYLASLRELTISNCPALTELPPQELPSTITSLTISSYKNLKSLDCNGLQYLASLRELTISNCPALTELPGRMHSILPSLVKLVIFNCHELESFPAGGLPSKLESLVVQRCKKLIAGRMQWDLKKLHSLANLTIGKDKDVESFPEEMLLPHTLSSLKIKDFQNLKSLNYKGLQHLSSLRELKIWKCRKLQSLPVEGLPLSLNSLIISGCSMLKERCERENGEDWPKISHIPSIEIDGVTITEIKY
ncbi:putative disease resistance RPP13-like protein 1 [Jatropha curcas]|uniref:putative disease resistance RPP13-like protein 1 n=1 Tax=Jatropha curcas TaxID=180498 RepID=UPI001894B7D1|nr:putative disease resistance RPP13-like protein 1 [Jatropha curcas]